MVGGHGFRRGFGQHQKNKSEYHRTERITDIAHQPDGNDYAQGGYVEVDDVITEQNQAQQAVRTVQQVGGVDGPPVAVIGKMAQTVAVDRHHAGFGAGKERGDSDQQEQDA